MINLFEFFERAAKESWSGQVTLVSTQGRCVVRCQEGTLVFAHRAIDKTLQRWKRLSWIELPDDPQLDQLPWSDVMDALLQANSEQRLRLRQLFLTDRVEVFLRSFFWPNVEIREHSHPQALDKFNAFGFYERLDIRELLAEAKNRLQEWPTMKTRIGSSKKVYVTAVPGLNLPDLIDERMNNPHEKKHSFSIDELEVLRLCDGHHSLQELIQMLPHGEFLTIRMILNLQNRGAIKAKEDMVTEGSVVNVLALSVTDVIHAVVLTLAALTFVLCLGIIFNLGTSGPCETRALQQALEIFRAETRHYPLTLNDLPKSLRIDNTKVTYSLLNPVSYQLECKTNSK